MEGLGSEGVESRFELLHLVGRGAYGEVFRAVDRRSGHAVAVKRLAPGALDQQAAARLAHEAELLSRVDDPHVVRYIAHGTDTAGRTCLVLEWLDGEALDARQRRAPLPLLEALRVGADVARGLAALHAVGIVHRDVTPANVMVLPHAHASEAGPRTKLIDLGIARAAADTGLTAAGLRMGTPAYMAPEQVRGDAVSPATDVYALGVVLYELLCGWQPFAGDDPNAVLARVATQDAPRLCELVPGLAPAIESVVLRAMARTPVERYPSAAALADALGALLASQTSAGLRPLRRRPSSIPPGAITAERRVVTALFAGFASGTERTRDLAAFSTAVALNGGVTQTTHGGRAIGVFGLGRSSGDEPVRAARAALRTAAAVPSARLALATCRVLVGTSGPSGDAIDRGLSQLERCGAGRPHGVSLDAATARLLEAHFGVERVAGGGYALSPAREAEPAEGARLFGQPVAMVGRERELIMLDALFDECRAEPVARVALLTAEPGAGKTRLCAEWLRRLRARTPTVEVLLGAGDPMSAGSPFGLIARAVRAAAGVGVGEPPAVCRERLRARVARAVPAARVARVAEFLGEMSGVGFPDDASLPLRAARADRALMGDQIRRAWEEFLAAECAARPVVVVLEDLHWGDLPSVRLVDAALGALHDRPVMVVALARPEVHELFPRLFAERGAHEVRLSELSRRAGERLVRAVLGEGTPAADVDRLVAGSGGNAFCLEELIRAHAEGRTDAPPETVLGMVQARLDALGADAKRVLRLASVFGQAFWRGGVLAMLGEAWKPERVVEVLDELSQREVIVRRESTRFAGHAEYAFRHALVRDAAYATILELDRGQAHAAAGEWLEAAGEPSAVALAEHFERGGDRARAGQFYHRAAEQALEGDDFAAALSHAARALSCGADLAARGRLAVLQAEAHRFRGEPAEAECCGLEAMACLPHGGEAWASAASEVAMAAGALGHLARLRAIADELQALALAPVVSRGVAMAVLRAAVVGAVEAGPELPARLLECVDRFAAAFDGRDPVVMARVHQARGYRELCAGDAAGYLRALEAAVACAEHAGDRRTACALRVDAARAYLDVGAYEHAAGALREGLASAEALKLVATAAVARHSLGVALARRGALAEARRVETEAVAVFRVQGMRRWLTAALVALATIERLAGDGAAAEHCAREALSEAGDDGAGRTEAHGVLASALLSRGRAAEALAVARAAVAALPERAQGEPGEGALRLAYAEALAATGDAVGAHDALAAARAQLLARAARITDPVLRQSYLRGVPEHARTFALGA